jgi:hypothetical protein
MEAVISINLFERLMKSCATSLSFNHHTQLFDYLAVLLNRICLPDTNNLTKTFAVVIVFSNVMAHFVCKVVLAWISFILFSYKIFLI